MSGAAGGVTMMNGSSGSVASVYANVDNFPK